MADLLLLNDPPTESVSSLDRVSTEVLQLIFNEACPPCDPYAIRAKTALDMRAPEWALGQVCSHWRQAIIGFHALWGRKIHLDLQSLKPGRTYVKYSKHQLGYRLPKHWAAILQERLLRSGNFPLELYLFHLSHRNIEIPVISEIISIVGAHSHHWRDAAIYISSPSMTQTLLAQVNGRLPLLETLTWGFLPPSLPEMIVAPFLSHIHILETPSIQAFPWPQLTSIILGGSESKSIADLRILQGCSKLSKITVHNHDPPPGPLEPELTFEHLSVLECSAYMMDVFLKLAVLGRLDLKSGVENIHAFPAFIRRTGAPITSFRLSESVQKEQDAISIVAALDMLRGLTTLEMTDLRGPAWLALVQYLRVNPNRLDCASLPNLQYLHLGTDTQAVGAGIEMIESRYSDQYDVPRLKSVEWSGMSIQTPETKAAGGVIERIKDLVGRGLVSPDYDEDEEEEEEDADLS
ncbi:hypothetical protein C8J56DRAFT_1020146 [Mycena floridula]|nr:hypothetical protein C8J56DRAFT_1020146 [Mycena floridula]